MKVKVAYLIDISNEERLALAHMNKQEGKASRETIVEYFKANGADAQIDMEPYYLDKSAAYAEKANKVAGR